MPYELWYGKSPNFLECRDARICETYSIRENYNLTLKYMCSKDIPKTDGYCFITHWTTKVFVARENTFLEEEFVSKELSGSPYHIDEIYESNTQQPNPPLITSSYTDETS